MNPFEFATIAINAVMLYLLWRQVSIAAKALRADHQRRKKQSTIEFLMFHVRPQWTEGQKILDQRWPESVITDKVLKEISENSESKAIVQTLLGHLEYMAVGINTGIYDEDILYRASGAYLIRLFHRLRPFVKQAQQDLPTRYIEFENLIAKFEKRKRNKPDEAGNLDSVPL